jgi:hypothetical protein
LSTLRSKIKTAQTSFYYFKFVTVRSLNKQIPHEGLTKKVFERSLDVVARFRFES